LRSRMFSQTVALVILLKMAGGRTGFGHIDEQSLVEWLADKAILKWTVKEAVAVLVRHFASATLPGVGVEDPIPVLRASRKDCLSRNEVPMSWDQF